MKPLSSVDNECYARIHRLEPSMMQAFFNVAGEASHDKGPAFAVTPDTLLLNNDGNVKFTETSFDSVRNKDYVPLEWNPREYFSDEQIEKIYVFALGVSVYNAADHNLAKDEVRKCILCVGVCL